jgi:hypothetical protein
MDVLLTGQVWFYAFILFAIINIIIANRKGFNGWAWMIAAGFLGLVILILLPSATESGIESEVRKNRSKTGTLVGLIISILCVVVLFLLLKLSN